MKTDLTIPVNDLDEAVKFFTDKLNFRVEMILPADSPAVVVVSGHGAVIRLEKQPADTQTQDLFASTEDRAPVISLADEAKWIEGRAGMGYRDLIPGRLGGRVVASLIRLGADGPVADHVHYHKVHFQLIYCRRGRVRVVYEDQGEPFWLHPGDCVLQPPGIRHRVLESAGNAEVIELTSPGTHETWQDHEMELPTGRVMPERDFGGQRFVHHKAAGSTIVPGEFGGFESRDLGTEAATGGAIAAFELRAPGDPAKFGSDGSNPRSTFLFLLTGRMEMAFDGSGERGFTPGDSILIPPHTRFEISAPANTEILHVDL